MIMSEFEFSEKDNVIFRSLSRNMLILSILVLLGGAGMLVDYFFGNRHYIAITRGIIYVIMAFTIYLPTDNFRNIAKTEGRDISELMTAFNEISKGWLFTNILFAIVVITAFIDLFQVLR